LAVRAWDKILIQGDQQCVVHTLLLPFHYSIEAYLPHHIHFTWQFSLPVSHVEEQVKVFYKKKEAFNSSVAFCQTRKQLIGLTYQE
jgi:hypothetical protein